MRTLQFLATAFTFAVALVASAQEYTQWGFVRAVSVYNPGLTQFEVLRNDERGGEVRFIVSPKDIVCPSGATYHVAWSFEGDIRRITRGQRILVNLAAKQLAGARCEYSEPVTLTGGGNWDLIFGRSPLAATYKDYDAIERTTGYVEFYLNPQGRGARHLPSPWTVVVGDKSRRQFQILPVSISTSGASGGQTFVAALIFDGNAAGSPASTPPTPPAETSPPPRPGMEMNVDRPGSDYRSFDLPTADPGLCQAQCTQEGQCVAWTYVNPGVQGPQARCWLKSAVPAPRPSTCCISGVKSASGVPPVTPVTPPVTPPQAVNLTGRWSANDGGTYYLRQIGNELWWYGRSSDGGASWSNVLHATIAGNRVAGRWADVPQGQAMSGGEMELAITSADRLTATRRTGGFGGSEWTRQR